MKDNRWDPPRIDEQAPKALLDLVRTSRARSPDDAALDRMSKRLVATARATPAPRSERMAAYVKAGVVVLVSGGIALLSWRMVSQPRPASTTAPELRLSVAHERAPVPPAQSSAPEQAPRERTEAISVNDLPAPAPVPASGSIARAAAGASASAKPSSTELELLKRAQAALGSDPERALSLTSEQARLYPAGEFAQEREVIAVEALARLGRKEESLQRALALVQRFPRTPYATRLERAVGRPLSSISSSANRLNADERGSTNVAPNP